MCIRYSSWPSPSRTSTSPVTISRWPTFTWTPSSARRATAIDDLSPRPFNPKKAAPKKAAPKKEAAPAVPAVPEKPIVLVPGPGTISGDNVNVRGQASFVGEIVKRLNKGDAVTVIEQVIREGYSILGLVSYFTAGEKEVRAWTIEKGWKAPKAASVIHTDFEKGFIRAEVMSFGDYVAHRGEAGCRTAGVFRVEGKEYAVADGDVMHFRFNV